MDPNGPRAAAQWQPRGDEEAGPSTLPLALESGEGRKRKWQQNLNAIERDFEDLLEENAQLRQQLAASQAQGEELQRQLQEAKKKKREVTRELKAAKAEAGAAMRENRRLEREVAGYAVEAVQQAFRTAATRRELDSSWQVEHEEEPESSTATTEKQESMDSGFEEPAEPVHGDGLALVVTN